MTRSDITVIARAGRPIEVQLEGGPADLRPKECTVVAALALRHPDVVTVDQLITLVWPERTPASARQSIHNHLARLRRVADGLVATDRAGYRFGPAVRIEIAGLEPPLGPHDLLIELSAAPHIAHARESFAARHRLTDDFDPVEALRAHRCAEARSVVQQLVDEDPLDERMWSLLAVASVGTGGTSEALAVLDRARTALIEIGLEPGRRLLDLHRLITDGVDSVEVLLPHADGAPSLGAGGSDEMRHALREIRTLWSQPGTFRVDVIGADSVARRAFLARLVDDARASGFATAFARCAPDDIGPPTIRLAHAGRRPLVAVLDGAEHCESFNDFEAVVAAVHRSNAAGEEPTGWVVTGPHRRLPATLVDVDATVAIDVSDLVVDVHPATSPRTEQLVTVLAALRLLGEPTLIDVLDQIVPGAADTAQLGARSDLLRVDPVSRIVDLTGPDIGVAELAGLDPAERQRLTELLVGIEFPGADGARQETRRAAFALTASGPGARVTLGATHRAAALHGEHGDHLTGARVLLRTMTPLEATSGRSREWCALAIDAGTRLLAGGDLSGDDLLAAVVVAARSRGDLDQAATAALEWCRLGVAAGAGTVDQHRLDVLDDLAAIVTDPTAQAQLGAAASMVLSLADRPDELRRRFNAATVAAIEADGADVLADVLPLTYMSLPLHSDTAVRLAHAQRLLELADTTGRTDARWEALQIRYSTEVMNGDPAFRSTLAELEHVAQSLHERSRDWEMYFIRSNVAIIDGDLESARRLIDESLAFTDMLNAERVAAVFGAHHLVTALIDGTVGGFLDAVRELATAQPGIGAWHAARAAAAAGAGRDDEALEAIRFVLGEGTPNLQPDPTYTAGLISLGEAAAQVGAVAPIRAIEALLEPLAGTWSWSGSCTFGPFDLTRARLALAAGDHRRAESIAADALVTTAEMRSPRFSRLATEVLLAAIDAD
jgi:DNA-binding SARP family transcriptional activator